LTISSCADGLRRHFDPKLAQSLAKLVAHLRPDRHHLQARRVRRGYKASLALGVDGLRSSWPAACTRVRTKSYTEQRSDWVITGTLLRIALKVGFAATWTRSCR